MSLTVSAVIRVASSSHRCRDTTGKKGERYRVLLNMTASQEESCAIPIIRLSGGAGAELTGPDKAEVVARLRSACVDVGFFYLQGHGIGADLTRRVFEQSRLLFELDDAEKKRLSDPVTSRGYTAMGEETLDPAVQTRGDTKEGFYVGLDIPESDPRYDPAKLRGPNQWPSPETTAMEDCDAFRSTMLEYHEKMRALAFRVVRLLALAIGLPETYFDDCFRDDEVIASLRLLHYAPVESRPQDGIFACGAHTDYGMITLLLTDGNPGLQILTRDGAWVDAPPVPDAFVVNLGDMLERWTNGLFRSTPHRVLTFNKAHRYSIPFFYEPSFDTVVKCLDACCSSENPPRYAPTTSGEHLVGKYKQTHADFRPEK
jgi:isopenicillin N synthase-like dioxygenase